MSERRLPAAVSRDYDGPIMTVDFGLARAVSAQSFGQPGQRTFRLRIIGSAPQSASLKLEKEHLRALNLAIRQVLSQVGYAKGPRAAEVREFPETAEHEFPVGSIGIGFDPSSRTVVLQIGELEKGDDSTLRLRLALDQSVSLMEQLDAIIAEGRPICSLCGLSIDPTGHVCIRSNGHSMHSVPGSDAAEQDS